MLSQLDTISNSSPSCSTGIPYVPFCIPSKDNTAYPPPPSTDTAQAITFSPGEVEGFQTLPKESKDAQCRLWLETFYPTNSGPYGVLVAILQRPSPLALRKVHEHPQGACVLTSEQCIQQMVAKGERKKEVHEKKERRKAECERNAGKGRFSSKENKEQRQSILQYHHMQ